MPELPYTDRDRRILAAWKREMQTLPDPLLARGMKDRLRAKIAERDAARGRPLTDHERLENLKKGLRDV